MMEFWLLVWIFYLVFNGFTCILMTYISKKSGLYDRYSVPVMITAIVLLSVFWPVTWLGMLFGKGKKDYKEGDENEDY